MSLGYKLLVQSVEGIEWKPGPLHRKRPNLYIAIYQDGAEVQRTHTIKRELAPEWEYLSKIEADLPSSTISLMLFHDSSVPLVEDECLGAVDTDIATLSDVCGSVGEEKVARLELKGVGGKLKGRPTGTISVRLIRDTEAAVLAVEKAQRDVENMALGAKTSAIMQAGGVVAQSASTVNDFESVLGVLTSRLEIIVGIGDEIAAIHPYANIAWKVLTSVYRAAKTQKDTDEKLVKLVETMVDVYSFVGDVASLPQKIQRLEDKALAIVQQTVECALFIQEYTAHGFCDRAVTNIWNHPERKIDELSAAFLNLKESFNGHLKMESFFVSTKILDSVERLDQSDTLKKLNPVNMSASSRGSCLPGTRHKLLDNVTEWVTVPSESGNVLWLSGVAGSGKSTISTTVSESFRAVDRLGAFLFFDRNDSARSHPGAVISTLAYKLALSNPHIASAVAEVIRRDPAVVDAPIRTQFKMLLLDPLYSAVQHIQGPVLIILDALDECGDPRSRAVLLSLFATEFPKLPHLFRILITSRRNPDIADKFRSRFLEMEMDMGATSTNDVELYFRHEMAQIRQNRRLAQTWPEERDIRALVKLSGGLFIWASTAVTFMDAFRPDGRLKILLAQDSTEGFNLNDLYAVALRNSGPWDTDKNFAQEARAVLACVVLGQVPMTDTTIDMILYSGKETSGDVLDYLGCVIQWSRSKEARILHASFADYLTDPNCSGGRPWSIDPTTDHHLLALGCLQILDSELRFNICDLEDSHRRNADMVGISDRVASMITPQLTYSSCFWFNHVQAIPFDKTILQAIDRLLHHKFLYWLETLSLLEQMSIAMVGLQVAANYAKDGRDKDLKDFLADAIKFVAAFGPVITQSAPHIYLSALPFAPRSSKMANKFGAFFPRTLIFQSSLEDKWPSIQNILQHDNEVNSVNFSPDGTRIASGLPDGMVRVWDAHMGTLVVGPLMGHTNSVNSINFSPNGMQIVSGSSDNTVRVWDAHMGTLVAGPFEGHTETVYSVHFSSNGKEIASGSRDSTVRVWDAHTGAPIAGPFEGHTNSVNSVNFSPNGMQIVSGSSDNTVRVWDAHMGTLVAGPFEGHTSTVFSVQFSPDGTRIASGSSDRTVCVWNAHMGTLIAGPFEGHTGTVFSVQFSPDGTQIVSGSSDRTVCVWDAHMGTLIAGPFEGHTNAVRSVHFSPDGRRIASASDDNTVRIWDAHIGAPIAANGTFEGHTANIYSVCFSPDGGWIASGSRDNTVHVWDAHTGALVAGPFEGHSDGVTSVQFSPDGTRIASGVGDGEVCIWDAQTGGLIAGPFTEGRSNGVTSVHFSPNGTQIVSGSWDKTVRIWDAHTGMLVAESFESHTDYISSINFSPDGLRIVSGSDDKTVRVWDAHTGVLVAGPFEGHIQGVTSVQFSPDGGRIASGSWDNMVRIWDAHTGALVTGPFDDHTDGVASVQFSPNGTQIASCGYDNTVRVCDAQTGALIAGPFEGHTAGVNSISFSPDGRRIVSGSEDNMIRVWEMKSSANDPHGDYRLHDGWVLNSADEFIFWVPPWLRNGLYLPQNSLVIGTPGTTKLDLSQFVHGIEWQNCIDHKFRDAK
ncbi:WD40-repeat-containing domain protein [Mycena epipterygia]|nr:WD40-repeat-containing domain protein [Mycena epipterygia]